MRNGFGNDIAPAASSPVQTTNLVAYCNSDGNHGTHLRDYWRILAKRKWWFFSTMGVLVGTTLLITFLMSPIYMVTVTLQIVQDNPSTILGGSGDDPLAALSGTSQTDRFYETQYQILQSRAMAYALIDSLKLQEHPSYKKLEAANPGASADVVRQKYVDDLLRHLIVEPVKNSFLVNVSYRSRYKDLTLRIPSALQQEYLKLCMSTRQQSYSLLCQWLDGELDRFGKKLEVSEQRVYENGQKSDFLSMEDYVTTLASAEHTSRSGGSNVVVQKYVDISRLLTNIQADRAAKEAQYKQIREKGVDAPLITENTLISSLRNQLVSLQSEVAGTGTTYGPNFPEQKVRATKMTELQQRIDREVNRVATSVKAGYEAAVRSENLLQKEYEQAKANVIDLQNLLVEHHILKRDLLTNQTLYEGLLARMKEASIASTMVASNVSVVNAAEDPYKPWMPRPLLFFLLSLVVGSLAGAASAFFVEYLDSSLKSSEEVENACHIPVLGVLPMAESKEVEELVNRLDLICFHRPMSLVSEAIFHMRTGLMLSASQSPPQVIVTTSANPSEGKSFVSSNLAAALAGSGRKTLLVDCDVRKPRLHKVFELPNSRGLTNYLTGNATLEEILQTTQVPDLYFVPAGPTPPNPNDLFISPAFKNLLDQLREDFLHVILDSPPVIGFADARSLAFNADGVVFAFKHHSTTSDAARLAVQLLAQNNCRILGGVLTMARKDLMGYGGYYGYYHNYHKHYKGYQDSAQSIEDN